MFYTPVRILYHELSQGWDCMQQNYKRVVCLCFMLKSEFLIMSLSQGWDCRQQNYKRVVCLCFILQSEFFIMVCPRAGIVGSKITNAQCVYVLYSSQNSLSWSVLGLGLQAAKLQTCSVFMFYTQVRILYHGLSQGWDCRKQNYKRVVCVCFMLKSEFLIMSCPRAGIVGSKITNVQCAYVLCSSQNS